MKLDWLNENSEKFLRRGYIDKDTTVEKRVEDIVDYAFLKVLKMPEFKDKFLEYTSKGYYSFSSPIWSNFGTGKGMPISCFGGKVGDSLNSIAFHIAENMYLSKIGGGTSGDWSSIRCKGKDISIGGKADGYMPFLSILNKSIQATTQGTTRRGSYAAYLDLEHDDIDEFLKMRDESSEFHDLNFGVNVSDNFIKKVKEGDSRSREIWAKVLRLRVNFGVPYIHFIDNVNSQKPEVYKDKHLKIHNSNLCTEIHLPNSPTETFVCCLSSMNLAFYNEWKNTNAVKLLIYFLDAVMTDFIDNCNKLKDVDDTHRSSYDLVQNVKRFAEKHRALGLGVLGYHSYLQKNMIPFESWEAKQWNAEVFSYLQKETLQASKELAEKLGEPELLKSYGRRNTTLMAIAPTKSSSYILGQESQGIEPVLSNYYTKEFAKQTTVHRNKYLVDLLEGKGKNTEEVWLTILQNSGSVQHLDFLTQEEKDVFKTFEEIHPKEIIVQAAQRQKYIDQGQSLNLYISPKTPFKELNKFILEAHELGIKSLYYQKSSNAARDFSKTLNDCVSCDG